MDPDALKDLIGQRVQVSYRMNDDERAQPWRGRLVSVDRVIVLEHDDKSPFIRSYLWPHRVASIHAIREDASDPSRQTVPTGTYPGPATHH